MRRRNIHREARRQESPPRSRQAKPAKGSSIANAINLWIYQYNLTTSLYMLEPWERALFNSIVLAVFAYIAYGLYHSTLHPLFERLAASYM